jgi:hypothetical protein
VNETARAAKVVAGPCAKAGQNQEGPDFKPLAVTTVLRPAVISVELAPVLLRSNVLPLQQAKMEIDICPRWVLARLGIPQQSQHHVALLVSTLLALALLPLAIRIPHFCLMQRVLGTFDIVSQAQE